jgi:hypothetical protein
MPRLKLKVESALHRYLTDELTDEEFKESIQTILGEFEGKNLLHQNIGQLTWRMEKENPSRKNKFEKIWILFDQVSPRIRENFSQRMKKGASRRNTS